MKKPMILSRPNGGRWLRVRARHASPLLLMLLLLSSMTGCSPHLVVIPGGETITVQKQTLDTLYQDNENLLRALQECRER